MKSNIQYFLCALLGSFLPLQAIDALSMEEAVGQLMIVHVHGEGFNDEMGEVMTKVRPGGVIYYEWSNNLNSPEQVRNLSLALQAEAKSLKMPPLWICTDQEGGRVCRLKRGGYTHFPSAMAIGHADDPALTRAIGMAIGQELIYSGVNVNFAPVVDIWSDSPATVIGNRCFGETPALVVQHAGAWLSGLESEGVMGCLKHFPGHGAAFFDTHDGLAHVELSMDRLQKIELVPYKELLASSQAIMTAHILVPSLDNVNICTKSQAVLKQLLKEKMGFQGIVFSDSLVMGAATASMDSLTQTCVDAIMAGCDVWVLGGKALVGSKSQELSAADVIELKKQLLARVEADDALALRVQEAAQKILQYKASIKDSLPKKIWGSRAHEKLAMRLAQRAVKWHKEGETLAKEDATILVAASPLLVPDLTPWLSSWKFQWSVKSWEESLSALQAPTSPSTLVLLSYEAWKDPQQQRLIEKAQEMGWKVVVLAMGTTRDLDALNNISSMQVSSPDPFCVKQALQLLTKKS